MMPATRCCARSLHGCGSAGATEDSVARLGGDEFAVILENLRRPSDAGVIADAHAGGAAASRSLWRPGADARGSIGIAVHPGDA